MNPEGFEFIRSLLRKETGVVLDQGKEYLVELRLRPLAEEAGFQSTELFLRHLQNAPPNGLRQRAVEALLIHETRFFRDEAVFELFRLQLLPLLKECVRKRGGTLGVWSAACSTGQEAYSLAILMKESLLPGTPFRLLATDFSEAAIARASKGSYSAFEMTRGLPPMRRDRYFSIKEGEGTVSDELKRLVEFRRLNLTGDWPPLLPMDVVFLRNVLIYFDHATKKDILTRVGRVLRPGGYLFLGGPEAAVFMDSRFQLVQGQGAWCYQLNAEESLRR